MAQSTFDTNKMHMAYKVAMQEALKLKGITRETLQSQDPASFGGIEPLAFGAVFDAAEIACYTVQREIDPEDPNHYSPAVAQNIHFDGQNFSFPTQGVAPVTIKELLTDPTEEEMNAYYEVCDISPDDHEFEDFEQDDDSSIDMY